MSTVVLPNRIEPVQRTAAKVAGFIYLLTIVTANFLPPLLLPRRMHRLAN